MHRVRKLGVYGWRLVDFKYFVHGGFLSHRGAPSYHPFIDWDFNKNHPASWGYPHIRYIRSTGLPLTEKDRGPLVSLQSNYFVV